MDEQKLTYEQFKADILQWKNKHREEYSRFACLMTNGAERQYLAICQAIFRQLPGIRREWELSWNDDSSEGFENIDLQFKENAVPKQIVELYRKQRDEDNTPPDTASPKTLWGRIKSFFSGKPKEPDVVLSAPLVLSWLYYGRSFEAMVGMVSKQARNPKADSADRQSCSFVARQIINVSIKNGFRTQADWDRYFAMNNAIENGHIGERALQSVAEDMESGDNANTDIVKSDIDAEPKQRTAGKKKIQERPLIDYLDCENKETVIQCVRKFISINTSAVHQALPFYVLKELRLVTGMRTAKEYCIGLTLQFPDLPLLKSESAIRQAVGFLKTAKHVIKDGKDQSALLIESDENRELFRTLAEEIKGIIRIDKETDIEK